MLYFSEFFDKEGYFQVAASKNEINNMDNYVIAHVIPDALYKVRFDDELHIRINANKRHGCVEATVKLTEKELGNDVFEGNEFSLKKFACEYNGNSAIRAIDENSGRGWFEENETTATFLNSFAAIRAYINSEDHKPLNPYDPNYYHNICQLNRYIDGYDRYEVGKNPEATLFFIRDSDNMTYSMVKPSLGKNIDFFPTYGDVSEKACEEVSYRKANILLEALLNKQPCLQDSDFTYQYRREWTPEQIKKNRVGVDFAFDRIETIEGNSIYIDDLPPLEELSSGKAFERKK